MNQKLLSHVNKMEKLEQKLDFLTRLYLWTGNKEACNACEWVRYELCKDGDSLWFSYPSGRIKGGPHAFKLYKNGIYWGEVVSKKEAMRVMGMK